MARSTTPKQPASAEAASTEPTSRFFRNISPTGDLWLPLVDAVVPRGGLVEVPAHKAHRIADQDVWDEVPVDEAHAELAAATDDDDQGEDSGSGDAGEGDVDENAGTGNQAGADASTENPEE